MRIGDDAPIKPRIPTNPAHRRPPYLVERASQARRGSVVKVLISACGLAPRCEITSAAHAPAIVQLAVVGLIAAPPYLLTLRICYPATSRSLRVTIEQILPDRRQLRWAKRRLAVPAQSPA